MKRALFIFVVLVFTLGILGFVAFRVVFGGQTVNWHQRLTVTVETSAGEVSGSSVTAVTLRDYTTGIFVLPDARRLQGEVSGEAVVVEVAPGRYLFVLLGGAGHWAYAAFDFGPEKNYVAAMRQFKAQREETPLPLPEKAYPLMVTFDDINDPKSVRRVDPDDLAASFGPGVSLKAVTLAVTEEPVTEGRVEAFSFWPTLKKQITFSGLQMFDPKQPDPLNYMNYDVLLMKGSRL